MIPLSKLLYGCSPRDEMADCRDAIDIDILKRSAYKNSINNIDRVIKPDFEEIKLSNSLFDLNFCDSEVTKINNVTGIVAEEESVEGAVASLKTDSVNSKGRDSDDKSVDKTEPSAHDAHDNVNSGSEDRPYDEVFYELKRKLAGLAWKNFFPLTSMKDTTKLEIEDFLACGKPLIVAKYFCRNQIIAGLENVDTLLKFLEYKEIACIFIDSKMFGKSDYPQLQQVSDVCRSKYIHVLAIPKLMEMLAEPDRLAESNCCIIAFKKCIKQKHSDFYKLFKLVAKDVKEERKLTGEPPSDPRRCQNNPSKYAIRRNFYQSVPCLDCDYYDPVLNMLRSSLVDLNFKTEALQWISTSGMKDDDIVSWTKKYFPEEYPIAEARGHLKIGSVPDDTWQHEIESGRIVLLYIKMPPGWPVYYKRFPLFDLVERCHTKKIPVVPLAELTEVVASPTTLAEQDCPALALRNSVLNRKSGFYGLYKISCEAIGVSPNPETKSTSDSNS